MAKNNGHSNGKDKRGTASSKLHLTKSEQRILQLVWDGYSNSEIATKLKRSQRTIEAHRASAMKRLGTTNVVTTVRRALQLNFIK